MQSLGQKDVAESDLDATRHAGLRLGISTHGIYEMLCAHACKPSYIALGAIFATATKLMPTAPQGLRHGTLRSINVATLSSCRDRRNRFLPVLKTCGPPELIARLFFVPSWTRTILDDEL